MVVEQSQLYLHWECVSQYIYIYIYMCVWRERETMIVVHASMFRIVLALAYKRASRVYGAHPLFGCHSCNSFFLPLHQMFAKAVQSNECSMGVIVYRHSQTLAEALHLCAFCHGLKLKDSSATG
jgi:hypothetical protein